MDEVAQVKKNAETIAEKDGGDRQPGVEQKDSNDNQQTVKGNKMKKADKVLDDQLEQN